MRRRSVSFDAFYFEKKKLEGEHFSMRKTFEHIVEMNLWGSNESVSGEGSTASETNRFKDRLLALLKEYSIKTLLDAPCGDFAWLGKIKLPIDKYMGIDILEDQINFLKWVYKDNDGKQFEKGDVTLNPLPPVDLILCRDCLVHFSFSDIKKAIKNFKESGSHYLLTTTFPETQINENIVTGDWRPLNLQAEPFSFSKPITLLLENCKQNNGLYKDKALALWELKYL